MDMGRPLDRRRTAAAGWARRFATPLLLAIPPVLGFGVPATAASLKFSFVAAGTLATLPATNPTLYANVTGGFAAAGAYWSSQFQDDITINIAIDYQALAPGRLGEASFQSVGIGYADVRSALTFDRRSVDDFTAVSSLPTGTALSFLTNNEQTGALQVDANGTSNNVVLDVPRANAKALGFYGTGFDPNDAVIDAQISGGASGAAAATLNESLALGSDVNTFFKTKLRMKGFTRFLSDTQTTHFGEDYTGTYQAATYLGEWHCTLFDGTNNLSVHFVYAPEHKAILLTRLGAHGRTDQDRT